MGLFNSFKGQKQNDALLASLYEELRQKSNVIIALQREIAEYRTSFETVSNRYSEANNTIRDLQQKLSEKEEALNPESNNITTPANILPQSNDSFFVLTAGKYKGGVNIPVGVYNIEIISGSGQLETNKPEELYLHMDIDEKKQESLSFLIRTYQNLEVTDKTILKITESAKIKFSIATEYAFSNTFLEKCEKYKNELEKKQYLMGLELSSIQKELKILNDECIKKYYNFSSYENLTSDDCKNKLTILKQEENELRRTGRDVIVHKKDGRTYKLEERIIRQMLRTFNCECDNIMLNISLKNIDKSRKLIQASFDTLNSLYSIDDIFLTKDLLKLKLEQITLMYTYELKYQQEKDIQKAIKEQMIEDAKVQKEIEEAKKKIDKDLQQYTGEINRLMKYIQKSQNNIERQLYIDKINALEEKIKLLQSDKENVLQREANAKAGFVYIISNIGSFGENIYKIGMTRRLEPMDRIKELSSASVPFEFDVHAMIFSDDAPAVEAMLHKHFEQFAVNKINPRKEFYQLDIDEIERIVLSEYNNTVQFTKIPLATEYRQSLAIMQD